jgi:hypothetical protein
VKKILISRSRLWVPLMFLLISGKAQAFPEMVRHGYINCTTCHVSPSGGGILTPYGRSMAKEILSRWGYEGEENVLHGAIKNESVLNWINGTKDIGFNVGGDIRYLQTRKKTPFLDEGKFIPMQRDIEGAFKLKDFTFVSSLGVIDGGDENHVKARRVYGLYQVLESLSLRLGRFIPVYGIMIPDHNTATRKGLGFDQGKERLAAEINYIQDRWSATLTLSKSPDAQQASLREKGISAQLNYAFADKYKLGISYWQGRFDSRERKIYGVHGILGFTHQVYALSEVSYQKSRNNLGIQTEGIFYYQKLGYEFIRGLHLIAQVDGSQSDFHADSSKTFTYGAGLMFFPRPHFDIQGLWSRMKVKAVDKDEFDFAYLMLHYYL